MEEPILISNLNDYIFCPISIYYHNIYGNQKTILYQSEKQLNGSAAHSTVDSAEYSTSKSILQGISVYSEKYNVIGKIDSFDVKTGTLSERKNHINKIYDGYIFQLYAQYFALTEIGYEVKKIRLHSYSDNKNFDIPLPEQDEEMFNKFISLLDEMNKFKMGDYTPKNQEKCQNCIYNDVCAYSLD